MIDFLSFFVKIGNNNIINFLDHLRIKYVLDNNKETKTIKIFKNFRPDLLISFHFRKKLTNI